MVLRAKTTRFRIVQEQYAWDRLITSQNPPGTGEQYLYGTCEETYPSCLDRPAHPVEKAFDIRSKPFQRTVSPEVGNNGPQHIRTKEGICKAMQQLVALVDTTREGLSTSEISSYIHDRFRAIRQELELQHIKSLLTTKLLEPMIRLTAIKAHEMCEDKEHFNALVMDRKELAKMFVSLKDQYKAHRQAGQNVSTEAEFTCYLILFKAEQDMRTAQRDGLAVLLLTTPDDILSHPGVHWALTVVDAIHQRNYVQFVKLLHAATYVQACFLHMLFLEEARESRMAAMTQAFKLKGALLSQLKDMMLLDSVEQVKTWLRMRDDAEVQISEDETQAFLPANPRPRSKAQLVSQRILSKRNGGSTSSIMMSALTSDGAQVSSTGGPPVVPMFTFSPPQQRKFPSPKQAAPPSPQQSQPHGSPQQDFCFVARVAEPDLARAVSENQANKHAAQQLAEGHQATQRAAAEQAAVDQATQEKQAAAEEKAAAQKEAVKQAAAAAERKAVEEREAALQAAAEHAARQAAAAQAKKRAVEKAARLESLRQQDEAFCRAGQNLEEWERGGWAVAEEEYAANVAFTSQLRKRYREQVAHADAEEQAAAQAQQEADRLMVVQACSLHTPPTEAWKKLRQQASTDQQQAAGVKNVMVAELAFSRLHLEGHGPSLQQQLRATPPSHVTGGDGGQERRPPLLVQPAVGALAPIAPSLPEPVLQRPKVCATRGNELVGSARDSARFHAAEVRGDFEKEDIPIVSRLRSFLSASRGR